MHRFVWIVLASGLVSVGCGGTEVAGDLPEPSYVSVRPFASVRYLTDEQIADAARVTEESLLADQLLGHNKKRAPVELAATPRAVRRVPRPSAVADEPWQEEEESVDGVLSDHAFQDTIHSWRGMRRCVAEATNRADDKSGALQVSFRIRGDGGVAACQVLDTSNAIAQAVAPCVEKRARRIRFPAFGGEEDVTKIAKFVF